MNDRGSRLAPLPDTPGDGLTDPRPTEAQDVYGVDGGDVIDGPDVSYTALGEAAEIHVVVVEDADHPVRGSGGVERLDGLEDVAGVPASADEDQRQHGHVTVPA
jgi:hypothetical protein